MFKLIKQVFITLLSFNRSLASIFNTAGHTECTFSNNQQVMSQLTLINLHTNEYIEGFHNCPFAINLDRSMGSCNTLNDLYYKVCVPSKTEDFNWSVFNTILGLNKSKIVTKHISCKCKCKCDGRKCNSNQKWNNNNCWCDCKNPKEHNACKKDYY